MSPIDNGNLLSDNSWKKIIVTPIGEVKRSYFKDHVLEISVKQFARTLQDSVTNEPTRFAHLALSLPKDISKEYIDAFYYGLTGENVNRIHEDYRENWQACSTQLVEQVIFHFDIKDCDHSLIRLLSSRATELSDQLLKLVINLSINSEDPSFNTLNIWNNDKANDASLADSNLLYSNTMNAVRSIAYRCISEKFWKDEKYALSL